MPLNASDATSGSPSPWKVFANTAMHADVKERRLICSARFRAGDIMLGVRVAPAMGETRTDKK